MIGWIGSILMSLCAFPQAVKAYREGHCEGLDMGFLMMWLIGDILLLFAISFNHPAAFLLFNYVANLVFLVVILRYKIWRRS